MMFIEHSRKYSLVTAQKMRCVDLFLWIWSHLLKKSLMENFIFCAVGVHQGSILGRLLFDVFKCDPFMLIAKHNIAYYANDSTTCSTGSIIQTVTIDLEQASHILSKWFLDSYLKANPDMYHVVHSENPIT